MSFCIPGIYCYINNIRYVSVIVVCMVYTMYIPGKYHLRASRWFAGPDAGCWLVWTVKNMQNMQTVLTLLYHGGYNNMAFWKHIILHLFAYSLISWLVDNNGRSTGQDGWAWWRGIGSTSNYSPVGFAGLELEPSPAVSWGIHWASNSVSGQLLQCALVYMHLFAESVHHNCKICWGEHCWVTFKACDFDFDEMIQDIMC
jgi:hypothetical protein